MRIKHKETVRGIEKTQVTRWISREYGRNKRKGKYCKTSSIIKSAEKLLMSDYRLENIRQDYLHRTTSEMIK